MRPRNAGFDEDRPMTDPIIRLNPEALPDAGALGYSQISIVPAGRLAFVSGQVAWSRDGAPVPDTLAAQAQIVLRNARAALAALGASPADLAMVRLYIVNIDPARAATAVGVLSAFFEGHQPSVTAIGVQGLYAPDLQLEMEFIVRAPG